MQHTLLLNDGETITFQLARRARRSVGLKISRDGLIVHAPMRLPLVTIEALILQKSRWISKKLTDLHRHMIPAITWQSGESLLLLGNDIFLQLEACTKNRAPKLEAGVLKLALTAPDDPNAVSRKVIQWYKKEALSDFARRLALFATRLDVAMPTLFLSNARSRWGSCNSKREIRLNWRLIQAPPHIINYVVCHELAHLKEMNHSAKFWAEVAKLYPDYTLAEKELKTWSPTLHRC